MKKTFKGPSGPLHYQHLLYSFTFYFYHPWVENPYWIYNLSQATKQNYSLWFCLQIETAERGEKLASRSGPGEKKGGRQKRPEGRESLTSIPFCSFLQSLRMEQNSQQMGNQSLDLLSKAVFLKHLHLGICLPQPPETLWKKILVRKGIKPLPLY